jgi:hypothetical protein
MIMKKGTMHAFDGMIMVTSALRRFWCSSSKCAKTFEMETREWLLSACIYAPSMRV